MGRVIAGAVCLFALLSSAAFAQESFYAGKSMTMLVPSAAGAGYDFTARLVARHMTRHIPGNPIFVVRNMPGGGGITMSNHLYNVAVRDGTVMALMDQTVRLNESFQEGVAYETAKFFWVGRLTPAAGLVMVYHTAPQRSLEDMRHTETIFAANGKGSQSYMIPTLMRTVLGFKTRMVMGYEGAASIWLAMERGEVQARTGAMEALVASHPTWVSDGKIRILAELNLSPAPSLPGVPLLNALAPDAASREVLDFVATYTALGFPFAATPDMPPERGRILRRAFDAAVRSPELVADMDKAAMSVGAATGEEMQALTEKYAKLPPDLVARTKRALEW